MNSKQLTSAVVLSAMAFSVLGPLTPSAMAQYYNTQDTTTTSSYSTPSYNAATSDPYSRGTDPYASTANTAYSSTTSTPSSYYDSSASGNYANYSSTSEYQPTTTSQQTYQPYSATQNYNQPTAQPVLRGHLSTVPIGTIIGVKTQSPINSENSHIGDPVNAIVENDVMVDGQNLIPAGSTAYGAVSSARSTGRVHQQGKLGIEFNSIRTPSGQTYPLRAHVVTPDNSGVIKGNSEQARVIKTVGSAAGITGAGTLAGTAIGGLLGATGSGALFGLGVGALGGIGYAIAKKGKPVEVPAGARLSLMVSDPNGTPSSATAGSNAAYSGSTSNTYNNTGSSSPQVAAGQGAQTNFQNGTLYY